MARVSSEDTRKVKGYDVRGSSRSWNAPDPTDR
jgi:hypothetical protein